MKVPTMKYEFIIPLHRGLISRLTARDQSARPNRLHTHTMRLRGPSSLPIMNKLFDKWVGMTHSEEGSNHAAH